MAAEKISAALLEHATPEERAWHQQMERRHQSRWRLQDRQGLAEVLSWRVRELLYGGAAGGGKSEWILWHAYYAARRFPGLQILALRRTYEELRMSLIARSLQRFDSRVASYRADQHVWTFKNGSTIQFGHLNNENSVYRYQSAEFGIIAFDELTQFFEDEYDYLASRNRVNITLERQGFMPHMVAGTNPGGIGHSWVKERFVDPAPPEVPFDALLEDGTKISRVFVPAKLDDNAYIDSYYESGLSRLSPTLRKAYRDGSWDIVIGQYFPEFDRTVHVVEPFRIPDSWAAIRALDFGYRAPFACLWIAWDHDGNAWVYDEAYEAGFTPTQQAMLCLAKTQRPVRYSVADPSTFTDQRGEGDSIAEQWRRAGMPVRKGLNARVAGWQRVRQYMQPDREKPELTSLRIFATCTNLIRTLPTLVEDKHNPEDCDTDGEDHAPDALRYGLMSRTVALTPTVTPKQQTQMEERIRRWHERREAQRRKGPAWVGLS